MEDTEVAVALDVSTAQAKAWLKRLVNEGSIKTMRKPTRYVVDVQGSLLGNHVDDGPLQRTARKRRR